MPLSLALICYIYKDYFSVVNGSSSNGMDFDAERLKKVYVIYDEPRLLIGEFLFEGEPLNLKNKHVCNYSWYCYVFCNYALFP